MRNEKSFYAGAITESSAKPGHTHSALRGCFFHAKCTRVQNRESLCNLQESEALQARYRLACELAKAGAELAFEYYQQREALTVDHKGDDPQDVVSVADVSGWRPFVKQRIQSAFPEDGFLGEESGARLPDARVLWVVDPIDGTQLFPQRPAHLVPVAGDRRRRRTGHRRGLRPQPSRAVSRPAGHGAWLNDAPIRPHPATTVKEGVMGVGTSHRVTPGGLSAVSAGAAQRRRHVYPQRLRGVDERLGGGGPVDWLLRAAHEPVGRPAGAGADARSGRRQQRFSGAGEGSSAANPLLLASPTLYPQLKKDDPTTITLTLTGQAISDYVLYTVTITSFTDEPHQSVRPPTCGEPPMSGIIAFSGRRRRKRAPRF